MNSLRYTSTQFAVIGAAMNTFFFAIVIYINVLWLMPSFFLPKRYISYALMAIIILAGLGYLRMLIGYYVYPQPESSKGYYGYEVLYFTGSGLINLILSIPIKYAFEFNRLQARQQQMANAQLEAEMKLLKMQLHPHFMFNTLNNLYYLTQIKSNTAPEIVEKLSDLMRYILEKNDSNRVALRDEINFMQAYMDLEKIRVPHLDLTFHVTGNIENVQIPPLLVLPLLENVFKHGVDKNSKFNKIIVSLNVQDDKMEIITVNQLRTSSKPSNRVGLANLRKRLNLLYEDNFTLQTEVQTDQNQFFAKLIVPVL
ncbi:MAG: sensor histidine kinase [Saprospiraceae bacterium]|nr:sensor histidine kinase [Saprospiraceae bacterium]